jgi:hypothetical protein
MESVLAFGLIPMTNEPASLARPFKTDKQKLSNEPVNSVLSICYITIVFLDHLRKKHYVGPVSIITSIL